jgi:hypothetical protein
MIRDLFVPSSNVRIDNWLLGENHSYQLSNAESSSGTAYSSHSSVENNGRALLREY